MFRILFCFLVSCSSRSPEEKRSWNLCPSPEEVRGDATTWSARRTIYAVVGKPLTFIGLVNDISDQWGTARGPTLHLGSPDVSTNMSQIYGHLPEEIEELTPVLRKNEKIKISGIGVMGCFKPVNRYTIVMDVFDLERVP